MERIKTAAWMQSIDCNGAVKGHSMEAQQSIALQYSPAQQSVEEQCIYRALCFS